MKVQDKVIMASVIMFRYEVFVFPATLN